MENTETENIENKTSWHQSVTELIENSINNIVCEDELNVNDLDILYKLVDIHKDICNEKYWKTKEENIMRYSNYGEGGYGNYGNYGNNYGNNYSNYGDNYGRRGGNRYRGHDYIDRMREDYGRYSEGRERYGHNEDTKKSLEYMLHSMEDFAKMLKEDAQSQEEVQMIRESAQRIAQM